MTHRKVKKQVVYTVFAVTSLLLVLALTLVEIKLSGTRDSSSQNDFVNKTIFENNIPVVAEKKLIIRPYTDNGVKIVTNYYSQSDDEDTQKNSLIFFENTYMPSTGISYQSDYDFDVVSILDGTVVTVKEDQTLGKIVEIKHDNNIISSYQSLSEILVKEGDTVTQGTIIGKSGFSNLEKELGSHLHFELTIDSNTVDPEDYYDKELGNL